VLLRDALRDTGKVGIAKVVIKTRQYLAAVKPNEKGLVLELMHFADELMEAERSASPGKDGGQQEGNGNGQDAHRSDDAALAAGKIRG